jgi:hypothetical protein
LPSARNHFFQAVLSSSSEPLESLVARGTIAVARRLALALVGLTPCLAGAILLEVAMDYMFS